MRRPSIAAILVLICVLFASSPSLMADTATDEATIRSFVARMWERVADKAATLDVTNPAGAMQATSAGGFWEFLSPAETVSRINDSPNTFDFSPHHVQVRFLGSNKDIAYVTFHLSGRITRPDGKAIENYRTRASQVWEKLDGKWVVSGSHFSPLFGGSGVVFK